MFTLKILYVQAALIEQENLFPKTNAAVKIFKPTSLLLGNRGSLQKYSTF